MESYDFYVGREYDAQGYLGSHVSEGGVVFRTFAPAADGVVLLLSGQDAGQGDGPHEYEMHVGRLYRSFLFAFTDFYVFLGGLLMFLVVLSGYIVYRRKYRRKKSRRKKRE